MPRAVDRLPLPVSHDPTRSMEFHVRWGLGKGVELWQEILSAIREFAEGLTKEVIQRLVGFIVDPEQSLEDLFEELTAWAANVPGLAQIVEALTGAAGTLEDLQDWAEGLRDRIVDEIRTEAGIDLASWDAFLASLDDDKGIDLPAIPKIVAALDGIPWESGDPGAILRAILEAGLTFVRSLRPEWLPQISLFSIGDSQPNLLSEPDFSEAVTVDGGGFYWDGVDGRTAPGCAAVLGDGEGHVLVSNMIAVSKDQELSCGGFVSHAGVSGSGVIRIELATFLNGLPVSTQLIGSLSPGPDSTDWTTQIADTVTIPDGVDEVALQLHVTSGATAGVVKFDDCWVKKQQKLKIPFVDGLQTALGNLLDNIQGIIDRIINAFQNFGEFIDNNLPIGGVLDTIFGLLDGILGNSSRTAAHDARIRALESAANTITLDFNGSSSSDPGPGFTVTSSGGGSGSMGLNGKGALVWKPSGAGNRTQIARYTTSALSTNNCVLHWVLASSPQSYIFDDGYTYVCARMNGVTSYVRVRSGYDSVRLQAVVSGSVTNIGGSWSGSPKAGDEFEWHIGDPGGANSRHHVLKRNGVTILDFTETTSVVGASNLHIGCGMETGNRLVITQNIPAGLSVLTAAEVL